MNNIMKTKILKTVFITSLLVSIVSCSNDEATNDVLPANNNFENLSEYNSDHVVGRFDAATLNLNPKDKRYKKLIENQFRKFRKILKRKKDLGSIGTKKVKYKLYRENGEVRVKFFLTPYHFNEILY